MFSAAIGTAGVISAYLFTYIILDPIEGQPVQLSYYLCVFGCGLVFWLLALLWAKLHEVAKLAKLITPITTLNLCGCLLAPFMKLPLLVRFLVLFQVSSNLALLLIWAFLKYVKPTWAFLKYQYMEQKIRIGMLEEEIRMLAREIGVFEGEIGMLAGEIRMLAGEIRMLAKEMERKERPEEMKPKESPEEMRKKRREERGRKETKREAINRIVESATCEFQPRLVDVQNVGGVGGEVDEAGGSGSGRGSGASGSGENSDGYGDHVRDEGGSGSGRGSGASGSGENSDGYGDHVRDEGGSGSGHGSGASGSGENSDGYGDHVQDEGGSGSGHGIGASGSGENSDGNEDHGPDEGGSGSGHGSGASGSGGNGRDVKSGERGTETVKISNITEMSLMLTAQTTAALIGFHLTTPSFSSKALLVVVLIDQLVAYLCGLTSILLSSNKPAAESFANIGFVCNALGFILMVAMFVAWYLVLIAVLLFGVIWLIFFRNGLKTRATEIWNYLKEYHSNL